MKPGSLESVAFQAKQVENSRKVLEQKIRAAREKGHPLRAIAQSAGMSHEQVRRIAG